MSPFAACAPLPVNTAMIVTFLAQSARGRNFDFRDRATADGRTLVILSA
jgi:hypothetical protein